MANKIMMLIPLKADHEWEHLLYKLNVLQDHQQYYLLRYNVDIIQPCRWSISQLLSWVSGWIPSSCSRVVLNNKVCEHCFFERSRYFFVLPEYEMTEMSKCFHKIRYRYLLRSEYKPEHFHTKKWNAPLEPFF